jgi:hypothetical protein
VFDETCFRKLFWMIILQLEERQKPEIAFNKVLRVILERKGLGLSSGPATLYQGSSE